MIIRPLTIVLLLTLPLWNAVAQGYVIVSGKIIDAQTKQPIAHAYIGVLSKGTGTRANQAGEFVFRMPRLIIDSSLVVAQMCYRTFRQKASTLAVKDVVIELTPAKPQVIDSTFIRRFEARSLVASSIKKIKTNYPDLSYLLQGFYQETLQQDGEYTQIKEATLQAEKDMTLKSLFPEKVKLIRGRVFNSQRITKTTEGYAFPNGANIVTHSIEMGIPDYLEGNRLFDYNYQLDDSIVYYLDKSVYRVRFWPINTNIRSARTGILSINTADSAIVSIEYDFTKEGLKDLLKTGTMDKVFGKTKREPQRFSMQIRYKPFMEKYYLQDYQLRLDTQFEQKKSPSMTGTIQVGFVVTDILKSTGNRIPSTDILLDTDNLSPQTIAKYEPALWGNANYTPPTELMKKILETLLQQ